MSKESINVTGTKAPVVKVVNGAGTEPITICWAPNMTVTDALKNAEVELGVGETAVIGEAMIANPDDTVVEPGQVIVIDNMPANG